jgi:hypothetical protein
MKKLCLLFVALAFVVTGCSTRVGDFTLVSTQNIELSKMGTYKRTPTKIKGKDVSHTIVFIPTKLNVNIEDAVDDALSKIPGAVAMINVVFRYVSWYVPLYGQTKYTVEGELLIDPSLKAREDVNQKKK